LFLNPKNFSVFFPFLPDETKPVGVISKIEKIKHPSIYPSPLFIPIKNQNHQISHTTRRKKAMDLAIADTLAKKRDLDALVATRKGKPRALFPEFQKPRERLSEMLSEVSG
jgi:hypothetical protein